LANLKSNNNKGAKQNMESNLGCFSPGTN